MAIIKVMDSHLANMIAAGEVIERPSSVIKELVENSLDAEAKHIEVRVYDAGRKKIIVKDDGFGMDENDAVTAFKRHASSKLLSEYELFKIKTMGFRGEALPSIAAVSKVTMITSHTSSKGSKVSVIDEVATRSDYPAPQGTTFIVEELFYNTPVRLKFLKTDNTENASSLEVMQRLALARSDVAFSFYIDDRPIFKTSGRGDLLEVISRIYSVDTAKKMIPVHLETLEYTIEGYIGRPEISKSTRYFMITILNERNVYVPKIQKAIIEAYSDHLFSNKYPFVILKIRVEHSLVDVNVHPSKREVRLSNDEQMADSIYTLIKDQLLEYKPLASSSLFASKDLISDSEKPRINISSSQKESLSLLMDEDEDKEEAQIERPTISKDTSFTPLKVELPSFDEEEQTTLSDSYKEEVKEEKVNKFKMPLLTPIGQIHNTYIICQAEDGFYLVDQHAANERINYEKFEKIYNSKITTCEPLIPLVINLNPSDFMKLTKEKVAILEQIGLEIESFGMNAIKVVREPLFIKEVNEESYIETLLSQVINNSKINLIELRKHVIATMACKASIKAHDKLSLIEMNDLIKSLFACSNPTCCPHGRPTIVHFSKYDIEKMFKRSGF